MSIAKKKQVPCTWEIKLLFRGEREREREGGRGSSVFGTEKKKTTLKSRWRLVVMAVGNALKSKVSMQCRNLQKKTCTIRMRISQ